jgi:glutathione S-transferase
MAIKLHRCPVTFAKAGAHACHRVQQALDEQGIAYEVVKEWGFPRGRRTRIRELTGQVMLPVIEFEDGTAYHADSAEMAARIRAGELGTTA